MRPGRGLARAALLLGAASCVAPSSGRPSGARTAADAPAQITDRPAVAQRVAREMPLDIAGGGEQGGVLLGKTSPGAYVTLDGVRVPVAADGAFLIAFGRDAGASARLEARCMDPAAEITVSACASTARTLAVAPRDWNIQSLPSLRKGTTPTPAFLARRKLELERIIAARAIESDSEGWRQAFRWPATGRISGVFGSQRIYAGEPGDPHGGVDVARPTGTPVAAPADGVVILAAAQPFTLEGHLLMIDHGMGLNSAFLHLSRIDVKEGDRVVQGQRVGAIGATGRATGPHLHWGMMLRGTRIDPQRLAGAMPAP